MKKTQYQKIRDFNIQKETLEKTLTSGNYPEEMRIHMNKKYVELEEKLNELINDLEVVL